MAGTVPLAFGGFSNSYNHAPRHIPVQDLDAPRRKPEQLTGYMIDPRYLPHDEKPAAPANSTALSRPVPALTPLAIARQQADRDWQADHAAAAETASLTWPHDWRRVVLPIAAMLFIIGLGFANQIVRTTAPPAPSTAQTTPMPSTSKPQTATAPTKSGTSMNQHQTSTAPAQSGTSSSAPTQLSGGQGGTSSSTNTTNSIHSGQTAAGGTTQTVNQSSGTSQPSGTGTQSGTSSTPLVGGRGGGDDGSASIAPEPGLPNPPIDLLPGK